VAFNVHAPGRDHFRTYMILLSFFSLCLFLAFIAQIFFSLSHMSVLGTDFVAYLTGGTLIREGDGRLIYDLPAQRFIQERFLRLSEVGGLLPFMYFPFLAGFLYVPFSSFPYLLSYQLFVGFNLIVLLIYLITATRVFPTLPRHWLMLQLSSYAIMSSVVLGQTSLFMMLFYLLSYHFMKRRRLVISGIFYSCLVFLKIQYIVGFPFLFLLSPERKKFLSGFILSSLAMLGINVFISGFSSLISYPAFLVTTQQLQYGASIQHMMSLASALASVLAITNYRHGVLLLIHFLLYFGVLFVFLRRSFSIGFDQAFVSASVFMLVFAYHVWSHDYVLLLPSVMVLLHTAYSKRHGFFSLSYLFVIVFLILPWLFFSEYRYAAPIVLLVVGIWLLTISPEHFRKDLGLLQLFRVYPKM